MFTIASPVLIVLAVTGALAYLERHRRPRLRPVRVRRDDHPRLRK